jgi:hypothetical protein
MKTESKGFNMAMIPLLLVLALIIGFTGWRVWQINRYSADIPQVPVTSGGTGSSDIAIQSPDPFPVDDPRLKDLTRTVDGPAAGIGYDIRFADGWNITRKQGSEHSYAVTRNEDLAPEPGVPATLKDYEPGHNDEFAEGLFIDYASTNYGCNEDAKTVSFKTDSGLDVYADTATATYPGEFGMQSTGDKFYTYCVRLPDGAVGFGYTIKAGSPDYSATVEAVIRTVSAR